MQQWSELSEAAISKDVECLSSSANSTLFHLEIDLRRNNLGLGAICPKTCFRIHEASTLQKTKDMLAWLLVTVLCTICLAADYNENLLLRPLPQSSLLASFNFHNSIPQKSFQAQNFETFPRSLGQILLHSHTHELHLRFSTGRWDSETWGTRPWNGSREGGTGVELWAWVEADTEEQYVQLVPLIFESIYLYVEKGEC